MCSEPLKWIEFKIIDLSYEEKAETYNFKTVTEVVKKSCFSSFLISKPKFLEPYYECEITLPFSCIKIVVNILKNRRSIFISDVPNPCTFLHTMLILVPVIFSVGIETDLRLHTQVSD